MISLQEVLNNPIVNRIGFALMHSLWQCAAIAVLFAVVMVALRKRRSQVRYNVAVTALLLMVIVPAVTVFVVGAGDKAAPAPVVAAPVEVSVLEVPAEVYTVVEPPVVEPAVVEAFVPKTAVAEKDVPVANGASIAEKIEIAGPYLALAWIVGVLVLSVWHLGGWAQLRRLRRVMIKPVAGHVSEKLDRLARSLVVTRTIEIVESALVTVPTVIGALKPVILLPASALTGLSTQQLEAILAHELAHIKRNDYLMNLIQTAIDILLFYHPAAWYVSRKIRTERENCCDDIAVQVTGDSLKYARALATMEEIKATNNRLAVAATGGNFFDRIARLVGKEDSRKTKPAWQTVVITMLVVTAAIMPLCLAMSAKATDPKAKELVEDFFKHNYRDITARKTIEWGDQSQDENGNITIRYKYEATIWNKDKVINNEIFTFDKNGKYVSAKKLKDTKTKAGLQTLVTGFFGNNYRDISSRKTIEWGEPVQHKNSNASIRYKYEATIRGKKKIINNQTFTFDKDGKFVSVKDAKDSDVGDLPKFKARLANGVELELIGICENPSTGKRWWKPDGSVLKERPYDKSPRVHVGPPDHYDYVCRLTGGDGLQLKMNHSGGGPDCLASENQKIYLPDPDSLYHCILSSSGGLKQTDISLLVGSESAWKKKSSMDSPSEVSSSSVNNVRMMPPIEKNGVTYIDVVDLKVDGQFRVIAIGKDGKMHIGRGGHTVGKNVASIRVQFDLPIKNIKSIEYQTQKFVSVTFKNVSLKPGHKTDVTIRDARGASFSDSSQDFKEMSFSIEDGKLKAGFDVGNPMIVHDDYVEIKSDSDISTMRQFSLKHRDITMSFRDGKIKLSVPGKECTVDAYNNKVRVQSAGKTIALADLMTIELPSLKIKDQLDKPKAAEVIGKWVAAFEVFDLEVIEGLIGPGNEQALEELKRMASLESSKVRPSPGIKEDPVILNITKTDNGRYRVLALTLNKDFSYYHAQLLVAGGDGFKVDIDLDMHLKTMRDSRTMSAEEVGKRQFIKMVDSWKNAEGKELDALAKGMVQKMRDMIAAADYGEKHKIKIANAPRQNTAEIKTKLKEFEKMTPEKIRELVLKEYEDTLKKYNWKTKSDKTSDASKGTKKASVGHSNDDKSLAFLSGVPEFKDLRLDMTEQDLRKHIDTYSIASNANGLDGSTVYRLYNEKGENVFVTFRNGKCAGIQRMRRDPETAAKMYGNRSIPAQYKPMVSLFHDWLAACRKGDNELTGKLTHPNGAKNVARNIEHTKKLLEIIKDVKLEPVAVLQLDKGAHVAFSSKEGIFFQGQEILFGAVVRQHDGKWMIVNVSGSQAKMLEQFVVHTKTNEPNAKIWLSESYEKRYAAQFAEIEKKLKAPRTIANLYNTDRDIRRNTVRQFAKSKDKSYIDDLIRARSVENYTPVHNEYQKTLMAMTGVTNNSKGKWKAWLDNSVKRGKLKTDYLPLEIKKGEKDKYLSYATAGPDAFDEMAATLTTQKYDRNKCHNAMRYMVMNDHLPKVQKFLKSYWIDTHLGRKGVNINDVAYTLNGLADPGPLREAINNNIRAALSESSNPTVIANALNLIAGVKGFSTRFVIPAVKGQVEGFVDSKIPEVAFQAKRAMKSIDPSWTEPTAKTPPADSPLQKLIDAAKPGDTVIVPKGTYKSPVKISKSLTLKGSAKDECILEVTANQPALFIDTAGKGDVNVEGLTIKWKLATSDRIEYASAVAVKDCKATIKNCEFVPLGNFRQSPTAARAYGFSKMYLDNCKFTGFDYTVCYSEATEGAMTNCAITKCKSQGIILYSGASADVIGNYIANSGKHAVRSTGGKLTMLDNLIVNNANRGVYLGNKTASGRIANNVMIGNGVGISGFANASVKISNNVILKSQYAAIAMRGSCKLSIKDNIIEGNPTGIVVYSDHGENNNTILRNTLHKNKENFKDIKAPANTITTDPLFKDAKNGDFSLKFGKPLISKQGLTNPKTIKTLWDKNQKQMPAAAVSSKTSSGQIQKLSTVKEFVIHTDAPLETVIDFDAGKTVKMSEQIRAIRDERKLKAWITKSGVDASVKVRNSICYIGMIDSFATQVDNNKWETTTPQEISSNSELIRRELGFGNITKKFNDLPRTYIFKTRQGAMGIFQISNFKGTPAGVKISSRIIEKLKNTNADSTSLPEKITFTMVDKSGKPVSGAVIGSHFYPYGKAIGGKPRLIWGHGVHNTTGVKGKVTVRMIDLLGKNWPDDRKVELCVYDESRKLGYWQKLSQSDMAAEMTLELSPVCRVRGEFSCKGYDRKDYWYLDASMELGCDGKRIFGNNARRDDFDLLLFAGEYYIDATGIVYNEKITLDTGRKRIQFEVKAGQHELDLGQIDLPAGKIAGLIGKPAPELGPVKSWHNGEPVKISDLKGKTVMLYFGGDSASAVGLNRFAGLHDKFAEHGLEIIAVYNADNMASLRQTWKEDYKTISEFMTKMEEVQNEIDKVHKRSGIEVLKRPAPTKYYGPNEVPFRVVIDSGDASVYDGGDMVRQGSTYQAYGIERKTSVVLIDKKGNVVGNLNLNDAHETIARMLGIEIEKNRKNGPGIEIPQWPKPDIYTMSGTGSHKLAAING